MRVGTIGITIAHRNEVDPGISFPSAAKENQLEKVNVDSHVQWPRVIALPKGGKMNTWYLCDIVLDEAG